MVQKRIRMDPNVKKIRERIHFSGLKTIKNPKKLKFLIIFEIDSRNQKKMNNSVLGSVGIFRIFRYFKHAVTLEII